MTDAAARIEAIEVFHVKERGEVVIYRLLDGEFHDGLELVSEQYGDRWHGLDFVAFIDPPPPEGFVRPPTALLRPHGEHRRIEPGEFFRAVPAHDGA